MTFVNTIIIKMSVILDTDGFEVSPTPLTHTGVMGADEAIFGSRMLTRLRVPL